MNINKNLPKLTGCGKAKKKIIVAMSGGVDSSVAAALLKDQGHDVLGVFLYFWKDEKRVDGCEVSENKCCSSEALFNARQVCRKLGIKLYTMNFSLEFKREVVDNFLAEYACGNTPNPCVRCNKLVKLGLLLKRARELGYDYVASGHYVNNRRQTTDGRQQMTNKCVEAMLLRGNLVSCRLYRGKDVEKDQSYFLYRLSQEQLRHLMFPLGGYNKTEVREMARKYELPVAEKSESQEICFIPGKSHNEFLKRYLEMESGAIVLLKPSPPTPLPRLAARERGAKEGGVGEKIGEHQGLPLYTIGQRRGIEIGGTGPYYAARMDYKTNTLYVVSDRDDPALYRDSLVMREVNWVSGVEPKLPLKCEAVIRYRHAAVKCEVIRETTDDRRQTTEKKLNRIDSRKEIADSRRSIATQYTKTPDVAKDCLYRVIFSKPQRAVTAGQSVVFYRTKRAAANGAHANDKIMTDEVLGGGVIG